LEEEMKMFVKTLMNIACAGVMFSLLALAAAPAYAQVPGRDVKTFVDCLNSSNPKTVADAVACVPSDCYTTVTTSGESAQPGCTLRDGTRLPRVIFSCPGPDGSQSLRFRPAFSLCTQGGVINHIELGEDVNRSHRSDDPELRGFPFVQKMADIEIPPDGSFQDLTLFGTGKLAVVDAKTPPNSKGCAECHDKLGSLSTTGGVANLFGPIPPVLADGTIYTNDPPVLAFGAPGQIPLSTICTEIRNSSQLKRTPAKYALAVSLCDNLEPFAR
jgi:hypothetical protein